MKAIVLTEPKKLEVQKVDKPELNNNEILIKIKSNGLCTNDIRDYIGNTKYTYPRIGGHEFSGEVVEIGENVPEGTFVVGDHVVKYIIPACGICKYCKINRENLCINAPTSETFQNENGISGFKGMAEYMAVDYRLLYKYTKDVSFEESSFTEPLACVINSVERPNLKFGQDVVVIGAGIMGLLHVMLLKRKGVRIIVSEPNEERRKLAKQLGAQFTFNPLEGNPLEILDEITDGHLADVVFNTHESPIVAKQAMDFTGIGGSTYMFSSIHPRELVSTDVGAIHSLEKVVTGTVSPTIETFYQAVQLISKGIIDVKVLIDKVFDYTEAQEAYEYAMKPETFKTIINFE
jgi:threonine dehydrogenase-like Zn-dependent dehydrogenase